MRSRLVLAAGCPWLSAVLSLLLPCNLHSYMERVNLEMMAETWEWNGVINVRWVLDDGLLVELARIYLYISCRFILLALEGIQQTFLLVLDNWKV